MDGMTNDNRLTTGTRLLPCFTPSMEALEGIIRTIADSPSSDGASLREAEASLLTIRANAASNTPGLYSALDAVRPALRAIEDIARRPAEKVLNQVGLLAAAQSHAQSAAGFLAEVLRRAKPSVSPGARDTAKHAYR